MNQLGKEYNQAKKDLVLGTMAGIIVGFGATVMLIVENPYLGAFLFAGALFIILSLKYNLFTGMVGYFFYNEKNAFSKKLTRVLIGNLIGTFLVANLMRLTRLAPVIVPKAQAIADLKLNDGYLSVFLLSIFCNMFVTNATHQFKYNPYQVGKYLAIFISIMTFALSGFEHSIADSFFLFLSANYNKKALFFFLIVLVGNIIGGLIIPTVALFYDENFKLQG